MRFHVSLEWFRGAVIALTALFLAAPASAEKGKVVQRLTPEVMASVYPAGADRLGPEEGSPPAIAIYKGDKIVAYVFSTLDIIAAPGYSSTPFDVIGGIDLSGHIPGAKVVFHAEPHILHDPVREKELDTFLGRQSGRALRGGTDPLPPDYVADSTVSARAMRTALLATAGLVLRPRLSRAAPGTAAAAAVPAADPDAFQMRSVDEMLADGWLAKRRITSGDVAKALAEKGGANAKLDCPPRQAEH